MPTNRTTRALSATFLGITLALSVAACGDDSGPATSSEVSTTEHNDTDVAFAGDMLQHHAQALSMVDLTIGRPVDPEVQQLAEQIRDAQAPEIETFTDWLENWDETVPETMRDHANAGHDGGDMADAMQGVDSDMPGMMSAEDMTSLEDAPDAEFQTMWLEMMIEHHQGALEMARTETDQGQFKPAIDLAESIVTSQSAEINTMQELVG